MHSPLKSLIVLVVLVGSSVRAQPEGEVVIRTRDGRSRQGRVLSETQKGYLFAGPRGTSVIEFGDIVDMQKVGAPAPVVGAPAVVAAAPVAAPTPVADPPSLRPVGDVIADAPVPERISREGFHFGLGASLGVNNSGPSAQVQGHFEFNFGRPVYRINANVGALLISGASFFALSVDNLFHFNIGDVYALGAGVQVGVAFGGGYFFACLTPVIQPVIIKLGDRGQHQLALTGSVVVASTDDLHNSNGTSFAGTVQVFAGYSYLF